MKKIGHFLRGKNLQKKNPLDERSVFFIFDKVIRSEYGNRGLEALKFGYVKEKKLFLKAENSNWANEVLSNRDSVVEKLNREFGSFEIEDILVQ